MNALKPSAPDVRRDPLSETHALRRQLRDLTALLALPALWKERKLEQVASELLDVLMTLLRLDCAHVRVSCQEGAQSFDDRSPPSPNLDR